MHRNGWSLFAALALGAASLSPLRAAADAVGGPAARMHGSATVTAHADGEAAKAALAVVERFERALAGADRKAALDALAPDLVVFESGHAERSREEYAASHLDADIAFLKTAQTTRVSRRATAAGDGAMVLSENQVRSESDGKTTNRISLETLLLRNTADGWRITHIHWSSRVP